MEIIAILFLLWLIGCAFPGSGRTYGPGWSRLHEKPWAPIVLLIVLMSLAMSAFASAACKPAPMGCVKRDGDWVDGVNKRACRQIRGSWESTYSPLDGPGFCDPTKRKLRK